MTNPNEAISQLRAALDVLKITIHDAKGAGIDFATAAALWVCVDGLADEFGTSIVLQAPDYPADNALKAKARP